MKPRGNIAAGRLILLRLLVLFTVVVLIGRLWQIQMVEGQKYRVLADRNRFRQVDVPAPRGVIYDRNGVILARNRPSFTIALVPADLPKDKVGQPDTEAEAAVLDRLYALLERPLPATQPTATPTVSNQTRLLTPAIPDRPPYIRPRPDLVKAIAEGRLGGAYRPVVVAKYVKEATAFLVAEDAVNLPGVQVLPEPSRDYPSGALTAHVIGYMGYIPEAWLPDYTARGYRRDEQVGQTGLEYAFEDVLRGKTGRHIIEVDVNGHKIRTVGELESAQPGHNLTLNLDLQLQQAATEALQAMLDQSKGFSKATQGAVVALDPRNGAVRALVSLPSHDNNLFAKGITTEALNALMNDPELPLFDRAIGGQYPPGSTFKIIVAAAGLEEGVISIRTQLGDGFDGVNDGIIWLPNEYFPWDRNRDQKFVSWIHKYGQGHGFVTVRDAIAVSDDIFFYQLGGGYPNLLRGLGVEVIGQYAHQFGLGELTGIDLPGEIRGLIPDAKWKRINYAENWLTGDTYNMSIGQGFVLATPLQVAVATAAVANRGYVYQPQLVNQITRADGTVIRPFTPRLIREVAVNPAHLDTVREGMFGAVNWPHGTAPLARVPGVTVAGKTGTAEYFRDDNKDGLADRDAKGNLPTHAWFTCFAPYVEPEIVVTVFVANGGEGSTVAAPVAARVLKAYFGLP